MRISVVWVDVAEHLANKEQPIIVVPRDNKLWISVNIDSQDQDKFIYTSIGDLARIPINAFRVPSVEPHYLIAAGMERVLRFVGKIKEEAPRLEIDEVTLFVAQQVHTIEQSIRFYAGFAITSRSEL